MKRITLISAAIIVMGISTVSCNNYVCPAYSQDTAPQEQCDNAKV